MYENDFTNPDLHMHSRLSDGTDSPEDLLALVRDAGIGMFALTDHDCYLGCDRISSIRKPSDPIFLSGIEFSCRDGDGKYHVLGYGFDTKKESIRRAADITHNARLAKLQGRLDDLQRRYGFEFDENDYAELRSLKNPGKPHIAAKMIAHGYAKDVPHAFSLMEGYRSTERYLSPLEAIDAILQADGIPVLAHGPLGDGGQDLSDEEIERRVLMMKECGLMGLECYYSGFTARQTGLMLALADKYNLFSTAGSDYHGTAKSVRLGDTGERPDPERMMRFYRAAALMGKIG